MKHQITRISVRQSAKVAAALYGVGSAVIAVPIGLLMFLAGQRGPAMFIIFAPVLYAVLGFIMVALVGFLYNFVAKKFGGIEVEVTSVSPKVS